jgi:NitT/TauT family transport system permease protein
VSTPSLAVPGGRSLGDLVRSPLTARLLFPLCFLAVWQVASLFLDPRVFPSPGRVFGLMLDELTFDTPLSAGSVDSNVYEMFAISLVRLFLGFLLSVAVGTSLGLAMGLWRPVDALFHDWVMAVLAMPALVWALFAGLAFGFGHLGPVVAAFLAGVPFVVVNVREGVRNTPRELFDMARAFDVPQQRITRHVLLPSLLPFFFAAMRYAFSIGWKGLVIAEVFASDRGAGWTIKYMYDAHRPHGVIGYALFFVIVTLALEKFAFEPLTEKAFKWRPQTTGRAVVEEEFLLDDTLPGMAEDTVLAEREG